MSGVDPGCDCVGYTIRTDYGTGVEYDVDRSSCPIHAQDTADPADGLSEDERGLILHAAKSTKLPVSDMQIAAIATAVEHILARQRPTAPPEDRVTAALNEVERRVRALNVHADLTGYVNALNRREVLAAIADLKAAHHG